MDATVEAAIANIPIGFCMHYDVDRLIVSNKKFAEIYRLSGAATLTNLLRRARWRSALLM